MLLLVFFLLGSSTVGPNPQVELGFMEFCVWCPSLPLVRSADSRVHRWLRAADSWGYGDGPRPAHQDDPGEQPGDREPSPALWRWGEGGYCETLSGARQKQAPAPARALPSIYMWSWASLLPSWPLFPHLCKGFGQVTPEVTSIANIIGLCDCIGLQAPGGASQV